MAKTLLTMEEAAELLRISAVTVRRLIADKQIKSIRVGRQIRIRQQELNDYLDRCTSGDGSTEGAKD